MKNNHGGAAAASGMDFQHRVSAWLAVRILAERAAPAPWDLGTTVSLEFLRCETEQPVDDILVGTSENGFAYIQVKKTLSLSEQVNSEIASVFDQFVRQFIAYREIKNASRPWERPLESSRDRLVLATSSRTSEPIRVHLVSVLNRLRSLPSNAVLEDAASNNDERRVFSVITTHLRNIFQSQQKADSLILYLLFSTFLPPLKSRNL